MTAAKKPNHTLHPTPVASAIRIILPIVLFSRVPADENSSFIVSIRLLESRISSPIFSVRSLRRPTFAIMPETCSSFWDSRLSCIEERG